MKKSTICKICGTLANLVGVKQGKFEKRDFDIFQCSNCYFVFVGNPSTNFTEIYSENYYQGKSDLSKVDYVFEMENPQKTIRSYEYSGVLKIISNLITCDSSTKWLDFGCGNGGLVKYCSDHSKANVMGYEEGWIREKATQKGLTILNHQQLSQHKGEFDVITAIEVIEHVENPIETLKTIRSLLKPGGLFFYTTGNAKPFRKKLLKWHYLTPEVHISFFEPTTMALALKLAGFEPEFRGWLPGLEGVIGYKVLITLHQHYDVFSMLKFDRRSFFTKMIPWKIISRIVNYFYQVSAHPIAWNSSKLKSI